MEAIKLDKDQISFLNLNYHGLNYDQNGNKIYGLLSFNLQFGNDGEKIIDQYQIEIDLNNVSQLGIPKIRETGNRIISIASQKNILPADLHLNNINGEMCIIIPAKTKEKYPNGFDLKILLEHIEEHLYWVSYFEKHDKEPWKSYGHGDLGYLQLLLEDKSKYSLEFKDHFNCTSRSDFRRKIKKLKKKYKL
jgi:hypothetical protein